MVHAIRNVETFDLKDDFLFDWCQTNCVHRYLRQRSAHSCLTDNTQSNLPITARLFCSALAVIGIQRESIRRNKLKSRYPSLSFSLYLIVNLQLQSRLLKLCSVSGGSSLCEDVKSWTKSLISEWELQRAYDWPLGSHYWKIQILT